MFQSLIIFATLLICIYAQRPFYASSNQYPSVLPQNLPANSELDNRFGGSTTTTDPYKGLEKDPVYNVEKELVDRIKNEYPRDKQPFWYVNAQVLNEHRYQQQQLKAQLDQMNELLRRRQEIMSQSTLQRNK